VNQVDEVELVFAVELVKMVRMALTDLMVQLVNREDEAVAEVEVNQVVQENKGQMDTKV